MKIRCFLVGVAILTEVVPLNHPLFRWLFLALAYRHGFPEGGGIVLNGGWPQF